MIRSRTGVPAEKVFERSLCEAVSVAGETPGE